MGNWSEKSSACGFLFLFHLTNLRVSLARSFTIMGFGSNCELVFDLGFLYDGSFFGFGIWSFFVFYGIERIPITWRSSITVYLFATITEVMVSYSKRETKMTTRVTVESAA